MGRGPFGADREANQVEVHREQAARCEERTLDEGERDPGSDKEGDQAVSARSAETWALRDALRDALSPRVPKTAPQLFSLVERDWGHVDERRLWRYLNWLMQRGIAVRLAPRYYNQAHFEDVGYLRGTGIEYPQDAADRDWQAATAAGICPWCRCRLDEIRPMWMRSSLCHDCYRVTLNDQRTARRRRAGLPMREFV